MTWFIDRRLNGKNKSMVNRQRFLRRYKAQIKQSISEAINKRSVTDVDSSESVSIPTEDISEPMFHQGRGGLRHRVHPGNDHFVQNDRIERPQGGGGGSGSGQGQASQDGEGQDEFVFQISKDEYLDLLFEDLALPNLKQNQQRQLTEYKTHRAGYTANGVPANISVVRSLQNSLARRTAMTAGKRRELHALEENLAIISNSEPAQLLEEERLRKDSEPCFLRGFCIQFITITPKFPLPSGAEISIISAPVPGRNRTLSGFLVSLTEGVPFIMKLHHRMLRHFIAASVIVLTSSFLIFELVASDRAMSAYLRYIVQKADSSFLYDKYQNQSIAAHVMRALAEVY
ncbi:DUF444 family protein, partial [Shigella flexneri]|nr:DUF444 family protein [Shigella flexneri]